MEAHFFPHGDPAWAESAQTQKTGELSAVRERGCSLLDGTRRAVNSDWPHMAPDVDGHCVSRIGLKFSHIFTFVGL